MGPVEIYKNYSHLPGFTSTLQPKSASPGGAGVTSGRNQLISGQKSADLRFRPRISIDHYIAFFWHFLAILGHFNTLNIQSGNPAWCPAALQALGDPKAAAKK